MLKHSLPAAGSLGIASQSGNLGSSAGHLGHRLDGDVFGLEAIGSYIIWELEDPAGAKPYLEASTANS
jgi:hypothetical protein